MATFATHAEASAGFAAPDGRAADAEMAHHDATLRRLVDANIIGVATCDAGGTILEANDAFLVMLGRSHDDLASGRLGWPELTPPEWEAVSMRAVADIQATGRCELFEKEYFRKDGSRVPVLMASAAIDESRSRIVAFVLDLTARKHAEAELHRSQTELRHVIETIPAMAWTARPDGSVAFVSRRWMEYTGLSADQMAADAWEAIVHPDDLPRAAANWSSCVETGEPFEEEMRLRRAADGQFRWFLDRGVPLRNSDGTILNWYGVATDIDDRKRAESLLASEKRLLQLIATGAALESERETAVANERSRLAGEIHDTLAQGLAMIVMQLADAETKLGPAWSQAEKPLSMVRELAVESLAFARRSVNVLRPHVGAGGLARSIRDVVDGARRHFEGSLMLDVTGEAVLLDAAIESALCGITREALTNAVKHSSATRITVQLNFAHGAVRVVVSDDGVGFDASTVREDAYGLVSMQERAARARVALTFVTEPGAGTTIIASWSPETVAKA
jgi:PAS domain S-box-containing protein